MLKKFLATFAIITASQFSVAQSSMPDVDAAHRQGFMGQGTSISTTSSVVEKYVGFVAPASDYAADGFYFRNGAVGGAVARDQEVLRAVSNASYLSNGDAILTVNAITVENNLVTGKDSTLVVSPDSSYYETNSSNHRRAVFSDISNYDPFYSQERHSAYLLGSASIIMSKYTDATAQQVVNTMDNSRTSSGAFSLQKALAPASIR